MQIQCAYCKNWIVDTVDKCPYCGAANANLKRYADTTPKTIAELQQWYTDRNLPPEETTRFFIGRNFKAPKAFGIYQEGKNFIVYKNKADGSRAVRYKGPDEAYAVNELYLKLKEEILHQKARNMAARNSSGSVQRGPGDIYRGGSDRQYEYQKPLTEEERAERARIRAEYAAKEAEERREREERFRKKKLKKRIILLSIIGTLLLLFGACTASMATKMVRGDWYAASADPVFWRYMKDEENGKEIWEWWKYTKGEWVSFGETDEKDLLPWDITKEHHFRTKKAVERAFGISIPPVRESKAYLTLHPPKPKSAYYYASGRLWYYATDKYGADYGVDRNGWYYFDTDDTDWHYLARYDDSEQVPEELFYSSKDYELTSNYKKLESDYAYVFPADFVWTELDDFKDTDYYQDIKWSEDRHYEDSKNNSHNNYDDDDDYDWDDDDDWDYNDYDWDSDW